MAVHKLCTSRNSLPSPSPKIPTKQCVRVARHLLAAATSIIAPRKSEWAPFGNMTKHTGRARLHKQRSDIELFEVKT